MNIGWCYWLNLGWFFINIIVNNVVIVNIEYIYKKLWIFIYMIYFLIYLFIDIC